MPRELGPGQAIIAAWRTNNRATTYLVEPLPNGRCGWIKSVGARHGVKVPRLVDLRRVRPKELVRALSRSSEGMIGLIELGIGRGGRVPRAT